MTALAFLGGYAAGIVVGGMLTLFVQVYRARIRRMVWDAYASAHPKD